MCVEGGRLFFNTYRGTAVVLDTICFLLTGGRRRGHHFFLTYRGSAWEAPFFLTFSGVGGVCGGVATIILDFHWLGVGSPFFLLTGVGWEGGGHFFSYLQGVGGGGGHVFFLTYRESAAGGAHRSVGGGHHIF